MIVMGIYQGLVCQLNWLKIHLALIECATVDAPSEHLRFLSVQTPKILARKSDQQVTL